MQQVDDPPSLPVGTEVSAKYKGAFCEAKVRKVVRNIKVKVAFKHGLGSGVVSDDAIKSGVLRVGSTVEVKHPDRRENVEATIMKIQDCSQYTVVFDDGDITTLRRTALCLKSGRHFNESETLDQLPLTHPEHFLNPVVGGRRGRRSRHMHEDSSDDDDESDAKEVINEREEHIGKVVCVESTDSKKKDKEKWFPGLVVAPTAQATVRIRVKDEYLVRSFKDGRYYTVPKKEATEFTREQAEKQDGPAVQAALEYLDCDVLPTHWDRDSLFGLSNSSSEYEEVDSDSSDDEPSEEKDLFIAQLYKYMDDRGTPLNKVPSIQNRDVDFYRLFRAVQKLGGYNRVTSQNQWKSITVRLGFTSITISITNLVKQAYKKFLQPYEEFHRKLGCSMLMPSRTANRSKGRSLVRANSVASPKPAETLKEPKVTATSTLTTPTATTTTTSTTVVAPPANDESENTSESSMEISVAKAAIKRKLSVNIGKVKNLIEKFEDKNKDDADVPLAKIQKTAQKTTERKSTETPSNTRENSPTGSIGPGPSKKGKQKKPPVEEKRPVKQKKKEGSQEKEEPPADFPVEVGDKLKVYYHEKEVTYEAKVIEVSLTKGSPVFLVHYTGWNNRYDEWVPRERIAENLTNNKLKKARTGGSLDKSKSEKSENPPKPPQASSPASGKTFCSSAKRGRGRSDSLPPRSTTPSSVASNSSRTKSPAASHTVQKKTHKSASATMRRISNNISDISIHTDSDSDSDEPVRRPPRPPHDPKVKQYQPTIPKSPQSMAATSNKSSSQSESEDDEIVAEDSSMSQPSSAKGRDYDLNQIRSELKGFQELKSPTSDGETDTVVEPPESTPEPIFDFKPKDEELVETKIDDIVKTSSTDASSDGSDSFGDDDSQCSDKTTTLENMTEKFQLKIDADKRALLEKLSAGKVAETTPPLSSARIEKIIQDTLAEKRQESLKAMPFSSEETEIDHPTIAIEPIVEPDELNPAESKSSPPSPEEILTIVPSTSKPIKLPPVIDRPSIVKEPLEVTIEPNQVDFLLDSTDNFSAPAPTCTTISDIYEFKEPEPFEFEVRKVNIPSITPPNEVKKKPSNGGQKSPTDQPTISPLAASFGKKKKASPVKDQVDKPAVKQAKLDDKISVSTLSTAMSNLLTPQKPDTTLFDALRKSPSFNLNFNALHEELATTVQETTRALTDVQPVTDQLTPSKCGAEPTEGVRVLGSPFIEITSDLSNVFELKPDLEDRTSSDDTKDNKFDLENVKILMCNSSFELDQSDEEKPSSIADKVLKALSQKKEEDEKNKADITPTVEEEQSEAEVKKEEIKVEEDSLVSSSSSSISNCSSCPSVVEAPPITEVPATTSQDSRLNILDSLTVKNDVLTETIQKLECVIQKTTSSASVEHFDEESSDSTDSEQRLIIEEPQDVASPVEMKHTSDVAHNSNDSFKHIMTEPDFKEEEINEREPSPPIPPPQPQLVQIQIPTQAQIQIPPKLESPVSVKSLMVPGIFGLPQTFYTDANLHSVDGVKPIIDIRAVDVCASQAVERGDYETTSLIEQVNAQQVDIKKEDPMSAETMSLHNESINLLLCEETIPGSPCSMVGKDMTDPLNICRGNSHPIESDIKPVPMDIECAAPLSKPPPPIEMPIKSAPTPNSSPNESASQDESGEDIKKQVDIGNEISPKKRRRTRKQSEMMEMHTKRRRHLTSTKKTNGSDSDDNSDTISQRSSTSRHARPCQYNFLVQLDPSLNPDQRVSIVLKQIQDLRKTYNMIKTDLASIDRRRKKLRRREREKKQLQMQQQSKIGG